MALLNVKKKIEKAADKLGIDEPVVAACTTNPTGTISRMLTRELGLVGGAIAGRSGDATTPADGKAAEFPDGQHFLVLTEQRLLVTDVSTWTGSPKNIVAQWPRADVVAIEAEPGRMDVPLTIAFSDGTAVVVEGARGTDPGAVADAFC